MKKVFIIHGFEGSPNGGWRPWLMGELEKEDVYACALSMPSPEAPVLGDWLKEIERSVEMNQQDEIYLVGHSLDATAILRYLESSASKNIAGAVLVSGPIEKTQNKKIENFLDKPFDFDIMRSKVKHISIIHGDNDPNVPVVQAETLARELNAELIIVPHGGHLNGSSGWTTLPQCLEVLNKIM